MLIKNKRFLPLFITQLLGAFDDNLLKTSILAFITYNLSFNNKQEGLFLNFISILFILPFFLVSATAGQVADKYDRSKIAKYLKIIEFILMSIATVLIYFKLYYFLILILFLMSIQSSFFGPVKYSLIPQHLEENELITGNAIIDGATYFSILIGTILGTKLDSPLLIASILLVSSFIGVVASWYIPLAPAPRPDLKLNFNIFKDLKITFKKISEIRSIYITILGISWFFALGGVILTQLYPLASNILGLSRNTVAVFMLIFSLGMAVGTFTCNKIMRGAVHPTFVPISAFGMSITTYFLYLFSKNFIPNENITHTVPFFKSASGIEIAIILFFMAFFGGMYIVPLNAFLQNKAPKKYLATIIAGNNILNAFGIVLLSGIVGGLFKFGLQLDSIFLILSIISICVAIYILTIIPDALPRSLAQSLLSIIFKIEVTGLENYEKAGKRVLLIANHTSLLDGLLVAAFMPEKIIFAINTNIAKKWWVRIFNSVVKLYPIDPTNPMALKQLITELKRNQKCIIFPEGRITVTGSLMKVYEGAGVVAVNAHANILPVRIDGAQYSKFSYLKNKFKTRMFPRIKISILEPTKITLSQDEKGAIKRKKISNQLYSIMTNMLYKSSPLENNLFKSLLKAAKLHGYDHIIGEDIARQPINYKKFLLKSYVLGEAISKNFPEKNIGVILPNSIANAVVFFSLQGIEKIPAMINFTQGKNQILSCIKTANISAVLTSKKMVELLQMGDLINGIEKSGTNVIYFEDFQNRITLTTKLNGFFKYILKKYPKTSATDPCTILFTSGSEGMPKAVLLSHENLQANRFQLSSLFSFTGQDIIFNALPMFHSFGLGVGTVLPILSGLKVFFYPSPVHYKIIPELVYDSNATILCGTDTFFNGYAKKANPYDFYNIKYAIVGAEKLKDSTYYLWMEKFGVRLLEGYGVTEASPVISVNTPMHQKKGSVGRLLPDIQYKLEKVEGIDNGGKLWIKGKNIMLGYLKDGEILALEDGWYDTGDIVEIDENGFISILGRAKRFAKIAGEMISLTAIEEILNTYVKDFPTAIVSIPDIKKGEQLILFTEKKDLEVKALFEYFKQNDYSELWIPKKIVYLDKLPLLGTGKVDYVKLKELALNDTNN